MKGFALKLSHLRWLLDHSSEEMAQPLVEQLFPGLPGDQRLFALNFMPQHTQDPPALPTPVLAESEGGSTSVSQNTVGCTVAPALRQTLFGAHAVLLDPSSHKWHHL